MFQFIETIRIKNGRLKNLSYHNDRIRMTRGAFFSDYSEIKIEEYITLPELDDTALIKCRVIYGRSVDKIEFLPYERQIVKSLKTIVANEVIYSYKYNDRRELKDLFSLRGSCDDILIIKNNLLTDTSYANIVLYDGSDWITPATPLLKGTCRARLIDRGIIRESDIPPESLKKFKKLRLINAMIPFEESEDIEIGNIII